MHLYGKNVEMTSPLEPLSQRCSNFMWRLPGAGEWKIAKMLRISDDFSSGASEPMLLKIHLEPPWGRGMKDC